MRPPPLMCFSACLGRDEGAANVDVDHPVQFLQRGLVEQFGNGGAGIVHEINIEPAEGRDGLFDRCPAGVGIGGVGLDGDRRAAGALDILDDRRGRLGAFFVRAVMYHVGSVRGQPLRDRGADAARPAGHECDLAVQFDFCIVSLLGSRVARRAGVSAPCPAAMPTPCNGPPRFGFSRHRPTSYVSGLPRTPPDRRPARNGVGFWPSADPSPRPSPHKGRGVQ